MGRALNFYILDEMHRSDLDCRFVYLVDDDDDDEEMILKQTHGTCCSHSLMPKAQKKRHNLNENVIIT